MLNDSNQTRRFFLPKTLNRAGAKDRLIAAIIDMIVLSVVSSFVIGTFGSFGSLLSIILCYAYFILGHKIFGVTVGKQAMGIFLASNDSAGLTWSQVILRETVWKWLSGFLLMYGYLRIYFVGEALHDKLSHTAVVSEKKMETSFLKATLVTISMVVIFLSSVYYLLMQTAFVGHYIVKQLEEQGHVIRGLKGNPKRGWSVDYWKGQSPQGSYELRGIRFYYDVSNLYDTGTLRVKEIQVSQALFKMNDLPAFLKKQKTSDTATSQKVAPVEESPTFMIRKMIVEKINFSNLKIERSGAETIEIKRFYIKQFEVDQERASIQQAFIDAPFIHFQLWNSHANLDGTKVVLKSEFELRKGLHRSILKTITGKVNFSGDIQAPKTMSVEVFDGRLKVAYFANSFTMRARNLTPSQYIQYDTQLTNITATVKNPYCSGYSCLIGNTGAGSFYHNKRKFVFNDSDVRAEGGASEDRMKLQLTSLWMNAISRSPIFSVSTDLELQDFVSQLYFAKNYYTLTPNDQKHIDVIRKDFFKYSNRTLTSEPKGALPSREDFNDK